MSYRIKQESSFTTIIKKSKFIGYSFFIKEKKQVKLIIENLKKNIKRQIIFAMLIKLKKNHIATMTVNPKIQQANLF